MVCDPIHHGAIVKRISPAVHVHWSGEGDGTGAFHLREHRRFKSTRKVHDSGDHQAMRRILPRRTEIALAEGVQRVAHAVHVIKKLAQHAAPRLGFGERVVRHQIESAGHIPLQVDHHAVVARAVVGTEHGQVGDIVHLAGEVRGGKSGENSVYPAWY